MSKNIHILPTNNPSRLYFNTNDNEYQICEKEKISTALKPNQNVYITNDEEIKDNDFGVSKCNVIVRFGKNFTPLLYKKIILTTDKDLIKDGIPAIDVEVLNIKNK